MKILFIAAILGASSISAFANDMGTLNMRCNLSDSNVTANYGNISNVPVKLKLNDQIALPAYNGHIYEISSFDISSPHHTPKREIMIGSRDAATNSLIATAIVSFSLEAPTIALQDGKVAVYCTK